MGDSYVIWAIVLFGMALLLFLIEVFVPSGGLIGLAAGACLIGGIVMLFMVSSTAGLVGMILSVISLPFLVGFALKLLPNTPIAGLLMIPKINRPTEPQSEQPDELVGAKGRAITDLRPVGMCLINGERTQCLADRGMIDRGTPVRVVSADGMQIKVCPDDATADPQRV